MITCAIILPFLILYIFVFPNQSNSSPFYRLHEFQIISCSIDNNFFSAVKKQVLGCRWSINATNFEFYAAELISFTSKYIWILRYLLIIHTLNYLWTWSILFLKASYEKSRKDNIKIKTFEISNILCKLIF